MQIASLPVSTTAYQQASSPAIGMAVLSKALDSAMVSGQNMIKMMEQSVNPDLGTNIDIRI
ncbi:MAG TPA: putative motility protein [Clostridiales bacterium]|nr:putative motility protein [Clostridiales bacterium]